MPNVTAPDSNPWAANRSGRPCRRHRIQRTGRAKAAASPARQRMALGKEIDAISAGRISGRIFAVGRPFSLSRTPTKARSFF
ncbi:MAG: hypothetical protein A3I06_16710 [Candidatus Lindowbacteria bacterium RIFCSPLOWO2_02_FULL_62_12]|nr:MAG: hypothetical protein A3I06_16710 [Candidatus Lindowbacteria bacterium RIFCSPLOWO2_02_FULL_62_12]